MNSPSYTKNPNIGFSSWETTFPSLVILPEIFDYHCLTVICFPRRRVVGTFYLVLPHFLFPVSS